MGKAIFYLIPSPLSGFGIFFCLEMSKLFSREKMPKAEMIKVDLAIVVRCEFLLLHKMFSAHGESEDDKPSFCS